MHSGVFPASANRHMFSRKLEQFLEIGIEKNRHLKLLFKLEYEYIYISLLRSSQT